MKETDEVFHGLLRPTKLLGLPSPYAMAWLVSSVLFFIWFKSWWVLIYSILTYPVLFAAAQWDPYFLNVVLTVMKTTRRTKNKKYWGGNSYEP